MNAPKRHERAGEANAKPVYSPKKGKKLKSSYSENSGSVDAAVNQFNVSLKGGDPDYGPKSKGE